jgi:hypothetical protein
MKLKSILQEALRDKVALEFLSDLVKKGPFKGKVYLAGGAPATCNLGLTQRIWMWLSKVT